MAGEDAGPQLGSETVVELDAGLEARVRGIDIQAARRALDTAGVCVLKVRRCSRLNTVSKPVLKAPMVSALETRIS